jgi:hypothetical protein
MNVLLFRIILFLRNGATVEFLFGAAAEAPESTALTVKTASPEPRQVPRPDIASRDTIASFNFDVLDDIELGILDFNYECLEAATQAKSSPQLRYAREPSPSSKRARVGPSSSETSSLVTPASWGTRACPPAQLGWTSEDDEYPVSGLSHSDSVNDSFVIAETPEFFEHVKTLGPAQAAELRRERKKALNNRSARDCRQRRANRMAELTSQNNLMMKEISRLREVARLSNLRVETIISIAVKEFSFLSSERMVVGMFEQRIRDRIPASFV